MTTRLPMVLTADEYARLNTQDEAQRAEVERYLLAVGIALPDAGE